MKNILLSLLCLLFAGALRAQTPSDALMMKSRESCFALVYEHGSFDHYWEGTRLRENGTIATVARNAVMPMLAVGILDNLNVYVGVPYVKTESSNPNGGRLEGAKGFQDLTVALKYRILNHEMTNAKLSLFASGGFSTPVTNYLSDYRPYSIGNGTDEWSLRGIGQYKLDMGFYARLSAGHLYRGQTKAERDYYYNNGSYYTPWMDVPSAWEFSLAAGMFFLDNALRVEAAYYGLRSTGGDDIRSYNAPQPTNKVDFDQAGISAQYFVKPVRGVSVLAYYNRVLNGRNAPQITAVGLGATYQFKL